MKKTVFDKLKPIKLKESILIYERMSSLNQNEENNFSLNNNNLKEKEKYHNFNCPFEKKKKVLKLRNIIHLKCNSSQNITKVTNYTTSNQENKEIININNNKIKKNNNQKIFLQFLTVGIDSKGLEYIDDSDNLYLAPKILNNYPHMLLEHELK